MQRVGAKAPYPSGQTTPAQNSERVFWRVAWSIVAAVFVLGSALGVAGGGRRRRMKKVVTYEVKV
jgi:anti-sigma-K factor RskA